MSDQAGYGQSDCLHMKWRTLSSQPNRGVESAITLNEHIIHRYYWAKCQFNKYACLKWNRCSKQKYEFNRRSCIRKRCKHTTLHHREQNGFPTNHMFRKYKIRTKMIIMRYKYMINLHQMEIFRLSIIMIHIIATMKHIIATMKHIMIQRVTMSHF